MAARSGTKRVYFRAVLTACVRFCPRAQLRCEAFLWVMTDIRKSITRLLQPWIRTSQAHTHVYGHVHTLPLICAWRGGRVPANRCATAGLSFFLEREAEYQVPRRYRVSNVLKP